jgi:hypothetical protein
MKKLLALTICLMISIPLIGGVAMAADAKPTAEEICPNLGSTNETSKFYVILEEPLGGPDAIYCFRVCARDVKDKNICKIKATCDKTDKDLGPNPTCQRIQIIEAKSGVNLLNQYVRMIYFWAAGTIGIIAVLTIVISGVQIMTAGGSGSIDTAKGRIIQAIFGLIVLFLSGLILYTINPTFFV